MLIGQALLTCEAVSIVAERIGDPVESPFHLAINILQAGLVLN